MQTVRAPVPQPPARVASPKKVLCSHCGALLNAVNVAQHANRCPRRAAKPGVRVSAVQAEPKPPVEHGRPTAVRICVECGARVQKRNFTRHAAAHAHQRRVKAYQDSARRRASKSRRKVERTSSKTPDYPFDPALGPKGREIERTLDGAREYGRHFREWGRFGSHSAYDDYGEESRA